MLGQAQTTSLFFSGQRLEAGTLSFPPHPYTFAVQKERLSDGVKDTDMGSRMTGERPGKGMDNEKGVQHVQYRALILCQFVYQVGDKGC